MGMNITIGGLNVNQWELIVNELSFILYNTILPENRKKLESVLLIAKDNQAELEKELRDFQ